MTVSPADAAVAARSFPRRWRGLFATAAGDEQADLLARSGAIELAEEATTLLAGTAAALPTVGLRHGTGGAEVLDRLESSALQLAATIESVPTDDWGRRASIDTLTAGIDGAAGLLRRAERAIEAARR